MKSVILLYIVFFLTASLTISIPLPAQTSKWTPSEIVSKAKPGLWVEVEATVQKDMSVHAIEIEFLTGDFMDDDWELRTKVLSVTPTENEFQVLFLPVKVTKETDFENDIKSLNDIEPEMFVELEGAYLKDGVFLAKEVENIREKHQDKVRLETKIKAVGKIGQVDESKRTITVMGIPFSIAETTRAKSAIK